MTRVAVVTGGSAGVGRATVDAFARAGWDVGIVARGPARLHAVAEGVRNIGRRAAAVVADVADADAVETAASQIEQELGPIDIWVNNAMATAFAPVASLSPAEFLRGTQVTYLGQVHGTMAALRRMRARDSGTIVNIGSALSYRAIPLQSVYCGAKHAVRGFTDSLRSELLHDRSNVHLTMVHLPAINTPQFDWALNRMSHRPQPVPPIFEPEAAASAILFAATRRRREVWVGWPAVQAIIAGALAPGLVDRYLARAGYTGQMTQDAASGTATGNLFTPVDGDWGAHGRFDARSKHEPPSLWTDCHQTTFATVLVGLCGLGLWRLIAGRRR